MQAFIVVLVSFLLFFILFYLTDFSLVNTNMVAMILSELS